MDAISDEQHHCDAVALGDSEVRTIPFIRLKNLFAQIPTLLRLAAGTERCSPMP
jgi:CRP/FNR family transcriptional regulator